MALQIAISSSIPSVGGGAKYQYLLDAIAPTVPRCAFSLRKLKSTYTGKCIRVRRDSDNTQLDIGFANNLVDTVSLLNFVGSGSGYVTIIYDQSGNGYNRTQSIINRQPRIVNLGVLEKFNGMVTINFYTSTSCLQSNSGTIILPVSTDMTYIGVYSNQRVGVSSLLFWGGTNQYAFATTPSSGSSAFNAVTSTGVDYVNNVLKIINTRGESYTNLVKSTSLIAHYLSNFTVDATWNNLMNWGGYGLVDPTFQYLGYYNEEIWFQGNVESKYPIIWANQSKYYTFI